MMDRNNNNDKDNMEVLEDRKREWVLWNGDLDKQMRTMNYTEWGGETDTTKLISYRI